MKKHLVLWCVSTSCCPICREQWKGHSQWHQCGSAGERQCARREEGTVAERIEYYGIYIYIYS